MARDIQTPYGPLPEELAASVRSVVSRHVRTSLNTMTDLHRQLYTADVPPPLRRWNQLLRELFPELRPPGHVPLATVTAGQIGTRERTIIARLLVAMSTFVDGEASDLYEFAEETTGDGHVAELQPVFDAAAQLRETWRPEMLKIFLALIAHAGVVDELPTP